MFESRHLAFLDGNSTLRIFCDPEESHIDEDLERIEWFEEFAWRETKCKLDFRRWEEEYLRHDPTALRRKAEREQAEVNRRHREAREKFLREQEIAAQMEAERKLAERPVSKTTQWRLQEKKRAEEILLKKKGFVPMELERKRQPLVALEEERRARARRIKDELTRADEMLSKCLIKEIPEIRLGQAQLEPCAQEEEFKLAEEDTEEDLIEELRNRLKERRYEPKFNWKKAMEAGEKRIKSAEK